MIIHRFYVQKFEQSTSGGMFHPDICKIFLGFRIRVLKPYCRTVSFFLICTPTHFLTYAGSHRHKGHPPNLNKQCSSPTFCPYIQNPLGICEKGQCISLLPSLSLCLCVCKQSIAHSMLVHTCFAVKYVCVWVCVCACECVCVRVCVCVCVCVC